MAASAPVVLILEENHSINSITPSAAPYMTSFAKAGRLFTHYREGSSVGPSLPDYLQLTAGQTFGCTTDKCPRQTYTGDNLFHQVGNWQAWAESQPAPCSLNSKGLYGVKHVPSAYFTDLASTCKARQIAYPATLPATMPAFTFVTPNLCNDMHDCSVTTGDNWLKSHVPALLAKGAIVVITFDESGTLWTAERGPGIPAGATDSHAYTHYSTLAGLEDHFGLSRLANAVGKVPLPL